MSSRSLLVKVPSIRRTAASAAAVPAAPDADDVSAGLIAGDDDRLGLYVHFPFCSVHCPYCDFAVDARAGIPHDAYADAVVSEIAARARWFAREVPTGPEPASRLVSVYFGGGTPALWRTDALGRVLAAGCAALCGDGDGDRDRAGDGYGSATHGAPSREVTVEANPGEVDETTFRALVAVGINRLSLGLQSLDDRLLRALGRNHTAAAGPAAVKAARAAGIGNISVDLMFGLPEQSLDDWRRTVEGTLALHPDHVSAYALTIERGTPFGARSRKGDLVVPDDELVATMQEWVRDALAAAGLAQYEVSSYARPGMRAVHNTLYWTGAPYLGVGASASSFRPLAGGNGWRFSNPRATETYFRACAAGGGSPAPVQVDRRSVADLENEAVWLGLRTVDGVERSVHARRFGEDPVLRRRAAIDACVQQGWLAVDANRLRPTPTGLLFADEVARRLWL